MKASGGDTSTNPYVDIVGYLILPGMCAEPAIAVEQPVQAFDHRCIGDAGL